MNKTAPEYIGSCVTASGLALINTLDDGPRGPQLHDVINSMFAIIIRLAEGLDEADNRIAALEAQVAGLVAKDLNTFGGQPF